MLAVLVYCLERNVGNGPDGPHAPSCPSVDELLEQVGLARAARDDAVEVALEEQHRLHVVERQHLVRIRVRDRAKVRAKLRARLRSKLRAKLRAKVRVRARVRVRVRIRARARVSSTVRTHSEQITEMPTSWSAQR